MTQTFNSYSAAAAAHCYSGRNKTILPEIYILERLEIKFTTGNSGHDVHIINSTGPGLAAGDLGALYHLLLLLPIIIAAVVSVIVQHSVQLGDVLTVEGELSADVPGPRVDIPLPPLSVEVARTGLFQQRIQLLSFSDHLLDLEVSVRIIINNVGAPSPDHPGSVKNTQETLYKDFVQWQMPS